MTKSNISTKKLKAIVFTDIVDFTKLSADDEQKALEVIDRQRELVVMDSIVVSWIMKKNNVLSSYPHPSFIPSSKNL